MFRDHMDKVAEHRADEEAEDVRQPFAGRREQAVGSLRHPPPAGRNGLTRKGERRGAYQEQSQKKQEGRGAEEQPRPFIVVLLRWYVWRPLQSQIRERSGVLSCG